jgi:hypothetical protein
MILLTERVKLDHLACTGRPAACRRIGVHVAKPRDRGRLANEGSRKTRVSEKRTARRAGAMRLPQCRETVDDMTRRLTTRRGPPSFAPR